MIGTPIQFSENEFSLHQSMCTLLTRNFGMYHISGHNKAKNLAGVVKLLNTDFNILLQFSHQTIEEMADHTALTIKLAQLSINSQPPQKRNNLHSRKKASVKPISSPETKQEDLAIIKQDYYNGLDSRLYQSYSLCADIFSTLYKNKDAAIEKNNVSFHQVCSYFILLGNILSFNMATYQTHPIYKKPDDNKIKSLLSVINNWNILLESYHLDYGKTGVFETLQTLLVTRLIDMKQKMSEHPKFIAMLHSEMYLGFSPQELNYHVSQKNLYAKALGLPYNAHVVNSPITRLYLASNQSEKRFFETVNQHCISGDSLGKRAQILFFYNEPYGNVDVFDVRYNKTTQVLEIINIHPGNSCAQHNLLQRISKLLTLLNISFQILACQANFGHRQQNAAAYALKLCSIISHHTFVNLKLRTEQPTFHNESHHHALQLPTLPGVKWFPVSALGDKAVLLNSSFEMVKRTLGNKFDKYQATYHLFPSLPEDPETLYTYIDNYRIRLAFSYYQNKPFHGLSLSLLEAKLNADDPGKMVRRAAAGYSTSREFRFLVETFKNQDDAAALHLPVKPLEYTPLQWALKERKPARAALLLTTVHFTEKELTEKNKDGKSACDYFKGSNSDTIKGNPVLKHFLNR